MTRKQTARLTGLLALAALSTPLVQSARAETTTTTTTVVTTMNSTSPRVMLNGQPLATSVAPQIRGGRTLVPMRDIFEALGATVVWNSATQEIRAQKGDIPVLLQIGNRTARVGQENRTLEEAPMIYRGSTLVPLRFVSEALGANVTWNNATRIVGIMTNGRIASTGGTNTDVRGAITIPSGAVVPVTLDETISSKDARVGDKFTATVKSEQNGDSEFPTGTKLKGRVTEVTPLTKGNPGVLGLEFNTVILPSGEQLSLRGDLISLDDESVTQTGGRIMAKTGGKSGTDVKVIGIGAGAGFILGKVLGKNSVITAILGAAGGYLYSKSKDKGKEQEAVVDKGSTLGVRLRDSVNYTDTSYYSDRQPYLGNG